MEYYNKVIESVGVRYVKGNNFKIERPVTITDYTDSENTAILLHRGSLNYGEDQESVNEGEILLFQQAGLQGYLLAPLPSVTKPTMKTFWKTRRNTFRP